MSRFDLLRAFIDEFGTEAQRAEMHVLLDEAERKPVALPNLAELVPELPKWCAGVAYDSKRHLVALRVRIPLPPGWPAAQLPVELVMAPDAAAALAKSVERCVEASAQIVLDVT
jgi:hypothetical protein